MNDTNHERRWPPWIAPVLLVAGVLAPAVAWLIYLNNRDWTVGKIEQLIRTEIPADSDREQVKAWFERHGIKHFSSEDPERR